MKYYILIIFACCLSCGAYAQYAPQAGIAGSAAIAATSGKFVGWATGCTIKRGYKNIAVPDSGYASEGDSSMAIGPSDVSVVSLGDSGVADLTFAAPIYNGDGPDFAVFENGFTNPADPAQAYLELAFVEVSSDGVHYFRFPATSNTQITTQIAGVGQYMDASLLNNLAGKYIARYGTPFDLEDLAGTSGLDVNNITHVRVVDVVGDIGSHACKDNTGKTVNDPYPTPYATGGFDLDAVGVIRQVGVPNTGVSGTMNTAEVRVYPNPATDEINIAVADPAQMQLAVLTDVTGKMVARLNLQQSNKIVIKGYSAGIYYLVMQDINGRKWVEKIIKLQD
ncbi:MAG: T9SS type A sorting domain-containing protein [Flavipsychrobacter sp.]|nr:T9SS type A sorting domain-containing protein [Flavipsychrobacter sp.]